MTAAFPNVADRYRSFTMAMRRITKELQQISKDPPVGCVVETVDEDLFHWKALIEGPRNSPYQGKVFVVSFQFPPEYPFKPPRVRFLSRIRHPKISRRGNIHLDMLNDAWLPATTVAKVLHSICSQLRAPNLQ